MGFPDEIKTNLELDLSELCRTDNGIVAIPVRANSYGKGLPYAPENWPRSGDMALESWKHWKLVILRRHPGLLTLLLRS
jgi:hypothetical protein